MAQRKSLLRKITKICLWILGILIAILIAVYYYLGSIVKGAINQFLPPVTGTDVQVEHVDLSLLSGKIEIRGLEIGNPKGYTQKNVFELGKIQVLFQPKSLFTSKILIDSIDVSGTKVSAELKNLARLESNVGTIQDNINSYLKNDAKPVETSKKGTKTTKTAQKEAPKSASKSVGIKKLKIQGTEVALGLSGHSMIIPLPDIEQNNIGMGKKSVSIAETVADILDSISGETLQAISKNASKIAAESAQNIKDILKNNGDTLEGTAKDAIGSLKGLFK